MTNVVSLQADDTGNSVFLLLGRSQNIAVDLQKIKNCVICFGKKQRSKLCQVKDAKVYFSHSQS